MGVTAFKWAARRLSFVCGLCLCCCFFTRAWGLLYKKKYRRTSKRNFDPRGNYDFFNWWELGWWFASRAWSCYCASRTASFMLRDVFRLGCPSFYSRVTKSQRCLEILRFRSLSAKAAECVAQLVGNMPMPVIQTHQDGVLA